MPNIEYLNDESLRQWIANPCNQHAHIIDVREPDEYAREHIPGSKNIPLGQIQQLNRNEFSNQPVLFHCKSGNRTQLAESTLSSLNLPNMYCLKGGIEQWKRACLPIIANKKAPLEIMRQVQIVVSLMILGGFALAYFISSYFLILPIIAGFGLLIAGLTGFCGMAHCLMCMPWNSLKEKNK